ncbi:sigma-70 family RNA polymerase sigma factor [uncultured Jatrophihabitans sp.]|uniref:sigma-70 family RNA polymerase sigma factor n=1 Tax=uncultured Jatrophihabitans sp. TaxID=1610747 RepID=UPI0035CADF13
MTLAAYLELGIEPHCLEPEADIAAAPASRSAAVPRSAAAGQREDALVRDHLPLVGHLVREVLGRVPVHVSRDDLISAGMYALAASARSWESERGVPFGRFAAIRIRGAITDELRSRDWASRSVRGKAREVEDTRSNLAAALGRSPSRAEVASAMGVDARDVTAVEADVRRAAVLSLQALTPEASDELLPATGDQPDGLLLRREQLGYLRDAVAELPERLQTVVIGHFFESRKMTDIAAELGVTESRISQLRTEALALLRDALRAVENAEPVDTVSAPQARPGTRAALRNAYCAAVAARSDVAGRLAATTVLGETRDAVATLSRAN